MILNLNLDNIDLDSLSVHDATDLFVKLSEAEKDFRDSYYNRNESIISDQQYDWLVTFIKKLESRFPSLRDLNSPTVSVGAAPSYDSGLGKVTHVVPMLSLNNGFSVLDIKNFVKRVKNFLHTEDNLAFCCEKKIDGLSFSASYSFGKLKMVATRGDGKVGENVTENMKVVKNFPQQIRYTGDIEIRGEVYISKSDFENLNKEREAQGKEIFATARNVAAGSLRQLDPKITEQRNLRYFVYSVDGVNNFANTQLETLNSLKDLGFLIDGEPHLALSLDDMIKFYESVKVQRNSLDFEIDGVVYKVNDLSLQRRLSSVGKRPRFAIAHKFPAILAFTQLLDVVHQVGRTGAVTPVAILRPVNVGGVTISRSTLHNYQEIQRKDIRIGDVVALERAGDVIPKICFVDKSKRQKDCVAVAAPNLCPSCQGSLFQEKGDVAVFCLNHFSCNAQIHRSFCHFVSRDSLHIEGLGASQLKLLLDKGYLQHLPDLFALKDKKRQIKSLEGWGERSVSNLLYAIERARNVSFQRFIYSLGIKRVGYVNAGLIARHFKSVDSFYLALQTWCDEYKMREVFHPSVTESLRRFAQNDHNLKIVQKLIQVLEIADYVEVSDTVAMLEKVVVFTGKFASMSRQELKAKTEKLGVRVVGHVSKNIDALIAGDIDSSVKLSKAQELNITVFTEREWIEKIQAK